MDSLTLFGLQRAEFDRAANLQLAMLLLQFVTAILAGVAVFAGSSSATYVAALLALLALFASFYLDQLAQTSRGQAERARRATLLVDGLGYPVSASEVREIEAGFTVSSGAGKKYEDPNYYAAKSPPGEKRLAEMLEESAFFTSHLMRASARQTWLLVCGFLVVGLFLLLAAAPLVGTDRFLEAVRVFAALLTLLVSKEMLGAALSYGKAATELSRLISRIDALRRGKLSKGDLWLVVSDYNSAVQQAPLVAVGVFNRHGDKLNELWAKHSR